MRQLPFAILLLLGCSVRDITPYDSSICLPPTDTCGPITPSPPSSYVAHFEAVDLIYNQTHYLQEYYHPTRQVLTIVQRSESAYTKSIFYYDINAAVILEKRIGVEDGTDKFQCTVTEISDSAPWMIGYTNNGSNVFIISPSQALLFGCNYKYAFVEDSVVRGMQSHSWETCIESAYFNATFDVVYYWSDPSSVFDIYGYTSERPVKMKMTGQMYAPSGFENPIDIDMMYNFALFDDSPLWSDLEYVFEIPSNIYCEGLPNVKQPPTKLADHYSMRVELTATSSFTQRKEFVSTVKNWYDYNRKLTRTDSIPNPVTTEADIAGQSEVSVIRDYRSGVEYIIDKSLGNCTTIFIPDDAYEVVLDPTGHVTIKDPLAMFGLDQASNLTYYGKKTARGLPCDVWAGHLEATIDNSTGVKDSMMYEMYFLEEGWRADSGEGVAPERQYPEPVMIKVLQDFSVSLNPVLSSADLYQHIFKFDEDQADMTAFDISSCFHGHDHIRRFQITFPGSFRDDFNKNPDKFTRTVHSSLSLQLTIPEIRMQHVLIEYSEYKNLLYCEFTLLDRPDIAGAVLPVIVGPPLEDVVHILEAAMQSLVVVLFDLSYDTPGHTKIMKANSDSLQEMFEDSCTPMKSPHYSGKKLREENPEQTHSLPEIHKNDKTITVQHSEDVKLREAVSSSKRRNQDELVSPGLKSGLLSQFFGKTYDNIGLFDFTKSLQTRSGVPTYGPGDMAGMGIGMFFLGLILGILGMMVGLRKFGLTDRFEFIPMSSRRS